MYFDLFGAAAIIGFFWTVIFSAEGFVFVAVWKATYIACLAIDLFVDIVLTFIARLYMGWFISYKFNISFERALEAYVLLRLFKAGDDIDWSQEEFEAKMKDAMVQHVAKQIVRNVFRRLR